MNVAIKAESVYFSVKGQVVIPRRLRKEFGLFRHVLVVFHWMG